MSTCAAPISAEVGGAKLYLLPLRNLCLISAQMLSATRPDHVNHSKVAVHVVTIEEDRAELIVQRQTRRQFCGTVEG